MERNLRIAAPVAGGAAVISLIVGLIAGVPIGTVLLRGFLSAAAFGGLALGAAVIARTQLPGFDGGPEVSSPIPGESSTEASQSGQQESGSRLNIVVEDDSDEASDDKTSEAENDPGETDRHPSPESSEDESEDTEELVDEVEESSAEDEAAVMKAAISEEQDGTAVEIDDTMLDEMPDIGSFAGSFVSGGSADGGEAEDDGAAPRGADGASDGTRQKKGDPRKGFDNKTIAKALQTFMAKDSE
jgi:hypothetical protein